MTNDIVKQNPGDQPVEQIFEGGRSESFNPKYTLGSPGYSIYGGYVVENEKSSKLTDRERYVTYSDILANVSIVGASLRYYLNLVTSAGWSFKPSKQDVDHKFAEAAEKMITEDPATPWHRVVRRGSMFRFYGFSVQEWTVKRAEDGVITFTDIAPRAQLTIERWDTTKSGKVLGVIQRNPQDQLETYLPREKIVYLVDDTINDSPMGMGLFRHVVEPANRLCRYEQLEGFGYESDLRGIPVGRVPYADLRRAVANQEITEADATKAINTVETFIKKHIKNPELGLVLDSVPYRATGDPQTPSSTPLFDISLLTGSGTGLPDVARAIERINKEIARILGTEHLLLGADGQGSHALSRDKTHQFSLVVNGVLKELASTYKQDLLSVIWKFNGWPSEMMPEIVPESVEYRDVEQITSSLQQMAQAGAIIMPDDEVINDIRGLLGVSPVNLDLVDEDASLLNPTQRQEPKELEGSEILTAAE